MPRLFWRSRSKRLTIGFTSTASAESKRRFADQLSELYANQPTAFSNAVIGLLFGAGAGALPIREAYTGGGIRSSTELSSSLLHKCFVPRSRSCWSQHWAASPEP